MTQTYRFNPRGKQIIIEMALRAVITYEITWLVQSHGIAWVLSIVMHDVTMTQCVPSVERL